MAAPLRLGLLADSLMQPAWIVRALTDLQRTGAAVVVCAAVNADADSNDGPGRTARSWTYLAYQWIDRWLFRRSGDPDALALQDIRQHFNGLVVFSVVATPSNGFDELPADSVERIRNNNLDAVLHLGSRRLSGAILGSARCGVWRFGSDIQDGEPGLARLLSGPPTTRQWLAHDVEPSVQPRLLYESLSRVHPYSLRQSLNRAAWKSSRFLERVIVQGSQREAPPGDVDALFAATVDGVNGDNASARSLGNLVYQYARERSVSLLYRDQWGLGLTFDREASIGPAPDRYYSPPADRFWADPFPIVVDGRRFVFIEELVYASDRGHISVIALDERGDVQFTAPVIEEPHHLSYPCVFRANDQIFMTPECSQTGRIDLYRAVQFPLRWERVAALMEGVVAADPTVFSVDGRWWMFVNLAVPGSPNYDECHLFFANRLEGPWTPHPQNPIRSDVRCARPAGSPFLSHGRWYRPAQDCSVRYGYSTVIHEIRELSRSHYREVAIRRILPTWRHGLRATHTFNYVDGMTVVDAMVRRRRF